MTRQWITLRNPLTLISDDTCVSTSISSGTGLFQPPKIVSHSSNRPRFDASDHARSGLSFEVTATSTAAMAFHYPTHSHR